MRLLIIVSIIFFIFLAFLENINTSIQNPFFAYLFLILKNFINYFPYYLILFCIIFLLLIRPYLKRKHLTLKIVGHIIFQIIIIGFMGIFFSFIVLVFLAFLELNIFSLILNQNPSYLGVKTDTEEIAKAIQSNNKPPILITNDENSENEVTAIAKAASGTTNFYGNKILQAIPEIFILPSKSKSNLLFLDNTLVVKKIDKSDMEIISPAIAYQIIKNYFPERDIKSAPKISVMDSKDYGLFRQNDAKDKLVKVDKEIIKTEDAISSISAEIESDTLLIEENENDQEEILTQRDKEYNSCLSEGTYESKVFKPKNTKDFCKQILDKWDNEFTTLKNSGKELEKSLTIKQNKLNAYRTFGQFFDAQEKIINISVSNVPSELGIFEPPASLRLVINNTSSTAIADYFNTLSHEYLHYESFNGDKRLNGSFFEEALTEYFAKRAIESSLNTKTNQGYPVLVKVIEEISNKISEPDLAEIYFNKDQVGLESKMDLVYGENFYKNNIVLFESLLYATTTYEALQIGNSIMRKIDGEPLKKEDLFSKESKI